MARRAGTRPSVAWILGLLPCLAGVSAGQVSVETYDAELRDGVEALFHGTVEEALESLEAALRNYPENEHVATYLGMTHARAGDEEQALFWLGRSADWGFEQYDYWTQSPHLAALRGSPRFEELLGRARANVAAEDERLGSKARATRAQLELERALVAESPIAWSDGHGGRVQQVLLSQDGGRLLTRGFDNWVRLWDAWRGEGLATLGPYSGDARIELAPDGETFLVLDLEAWTADLHDARGGQHLASLHDADRFVVWARFDPVEARILTLDDRGKLESWSSRSGARLDSPERASSSEWPFSVDLSTDGRLVAIRHPASGVLLVDTRTHEPRAALADRDRVVMGVTLDPDGRWAWTKCLDGSVKSWDVVTGVPGVTLPMKTWPKQIVPSPIGGRLVTVDWGGTPQLWDSRGGAPIQLAGDPVENVEFVAWSPEGSRFVTTGAETEPRLWDSESGALLGTPGHGGRYRTRRAYFTPDGSQLLTVGGAIGARLDRFDAWSGEFIEKVDGPGSGTLNGAPELSSSGERIAIGRFGSAVILGPSGKRTALRNRAARPLSIAFMDATRLIVAGKDLRAWDLERADNVSLPHNVRELRVHSDGRRVVTVGGTHFGIHDMVSGLDLVRTPLAPNGFRCDLSPLEDRWLVTYSDDLAIATDLLEFDTGVRIARLEATSPKENITRYSCVPTFSPDGRLVLSTDESHRLRVWSADDAAPLGTLEGHVDRIRHLGFSPDGELLVSCSKDFTARLWDAGTFQEVAVLEHGAWVWHAAFSPDGERLATGSRNGEVRLWDVRAATSTTLGRQGGPVSHVAYHPDGSRVLSVAEDGTAVLWDVTGEPRLDLNLRGHLGPVIQGEFSPDGARVATMSDDCTARVWEADTGALLVTLVDYGADGWLAFAPSGHYVDGGRAADLARVVGRDGEYPLSSYADVLRSPGDVRAALRGELPSRIFLHDAPQLELFTESGEVVERAFELELVVRDGVGIASLTVTQDGQVLDAGVVERALQLDPGARRGRLSLKMRIPADRESTVVEVRAENARGILSAPRTAELRHVAPRSRLFLLAIGVADYASDELDLAYPTQDVDDLIAAFQAQEGLFYDEVKVERLVDDEVSLAALNRLKSKWLVQAGPRDTIVVFAAGHAVNDDSGEYWFLTSDSTPDNPYAGIEGLNLGRMVTWSRLACPRRVLMVDTCHSGRTADVRGVSPLLHAPDVEELEQQEGTGVYVFGASGPGQLAREQDGNGLFTAAVLEALAGAADLRPHGNGDGGVQIEEVRRFVEERVHERSGGTQTPMLGLVQGGQDFRIGKVAR